MAYARWAIEPVTEGHVEIIPNRHEESFMALSPEEFTAIHGLSLFVRDVLTSEYGANGFTIGVNEGEASGRLVAHTSLHMIPRFNGDVPNPRGGIRYVIPEREITSADHRLGWTKYCQPGL